MQLVQAPVVAQLEARCRGLGYSEADVARVVAEHKSRWDAAGQNIAAATMSVWRA